MVWECSAGCSTIQVHFVFVFTLFLCSQHFFIDFLAQKWVLLIQKFHTNKKQMYNRYSGKQPKYIVRSWSPHAFSHRVLLLWLHLSIFIQPRWNNSYSVGLQQLTAKPLSSENCQNLIGSTVVECSQKWLLLYRVWNDYWELNFQESWFSLKFGQKPK